MGDAEFAKEQTKHAFTVASFTVAPASPQARGAARAMMNVNVAFHSNQATADAPPGYAVTKGWWADSHELPLWPRTQAQSARDRARRLEPRAVWMLLGA
eukprot:7381075-Prymnesium_polylepis.2